MWNLNESQLERLLTDSLKGKGDDDLHRCEIGFEDSPSLQFANSYKMQMAYGWPVASRS
jgi:hypothetical protein